MAAYRVLRRASDGAALLTRVKWCQGFGDKLRGLMFRRQITDDEGLIFVYGRESKVDTSIHMFFMNFDIACIWLDKEGRVVDKVLAKRWRPAYAPRVPAQYVVEASPALFDKVQVGEVLRFED